MTALWYAIRGTSLLCVLVVVCVFIRTAGGPGSGGLEHQLRSAEKDNTAVLSRPHEFQQDPASYLTGFCRCKRWHWHHLHTGDCLTCACDDCRAYRERTFSA